jgi:fructuronate reductase
VHLGVGNFHRAHQAVYVDDCLAADGSWGIRGVSLRRPDMRDALAPQDGLYTLAVKDGATTKARIVGSILDMLVATEDIEPVLAAMTDPATRIVSLTVTEKGYCHDPSNGDLDPQNAGIIADLDRPDRPSTVPGLLVEALRRRRNAGVAPFTVLSCDNLPSNGRTLGRIVGQYAALIDDALAQWIGGTIAFPSTMVDRIVPATSDADRSAIAALTGFDDAWPVVTEPYTQWVIEDVFPAGRPDFAAAGAELVADVAPFERMKLRMLNGAHWTLAYVGQLLGHETVADAMQDSALARLVAQVMDEAAATLDLPAADLAAYGRALRTRFANPALRHRTAQIAMDGSQKIPQRLLGSIRDAQAAGQEWGALATGVAAWIAFLWQGPVDDPMADRFLALADKHADPAGHAEAVLGMREVFGTLSDADWFGDRIVGIVGKMADAGPGAVLPR